jgi:hypothetical protein
VALDRFFLKDLREFLASLPLQQFQNPERVVLLL